MAITRCRALPLESNIKHLFPDDLTISLSSNKLMANSVWGILRGLETFSQLVYENGDGTVRGYRLYYILV